MRKRVDCREMPSESGCSLLISGEEDEVVRAAVEHAVSVHGHQDTPELRQAVREGLQNETPAGRYGTVAIATLSGGQEELRRVSAEWERERHVPGFLREEVLVGEDGRTVVTAVFFASQEDYARLGTDPAQDEFWRTRIAPLLDGEPRWIDGRWTDPVVPTAIRLPEQRAATHDAEVQSQPVTG